MIEISVLCTFYPKFHAHFPSEPPKIIVKHIAGNAHTTLSFAQDICVSKFQLSFLMARLKITIDPDP